MELPPNIDSKFRLVLLVAARARQLQAGARPLIQTQSTKVTKIAFQEVSAGLVPFDIYEDSSDEDKEKKAKSAK
jgi:DNA-directed RNA polymerase omega subunit